MEKFPKKSVELFLKQFLEDFPKIVERVLEAIFNYFIYTILNKYLNKRDFLKFHAILFSNFFLKKNLIDFISDISATIPGRVSE